MITERELMQLKKEVSEKRDMYIKAKATKDEVENLITSLKEDLKELGVKNIDNVEEELKEIDSKIEELYSKAKEKISNLI